MRHLLMVMALMVCTLVSGFADNPPVPPMKLKVGDTAPDFTLRDQNGKQVSLHDFRDKKTVVLAVFVFAFTGG